MQSSTFGMHDSSLSQSTPVQASSAGMPSTFIPQPTPSQSSSAEISASTSHISGTVRETSSIQASPVSTANSFDGISTVSVQRPQIFTLQYNHQTAAREGREVDSNLRVPVVEVMDILATMVPVVPELVPTTTTTTYWGRYNWYDSDYNYSDNHYSWVPISLRLILRLFCVTNHPDSIGFCIVKESQHPVKKCLRVYTLLLQFHFNKCELFCSTFATIFAIASEHLWGKSRP